MYANNEAIEHLAHALELLPREEMRERMTTTEQLADAYFLAGLYARADSLLQEMEGGLSETLDMVRVQRKRAELLGYSAGTPRKVVDLLWQAARQLGAHRPASRLLYLGSTVKALGTHFVQSWTSRRLRRIDEPTQRVRIAELVAVYLRISYFSFFSEPLLFFLPIFRAANLVDRVPDSTQHPQVYSLMGIALGGLGFSKRALRYGRQAIEDATRNDSTWHLANAQSFHSLVLLQTGHWDEALTFAERARSAFAACGDHFELAVSVVAVMEALHARGDLTGAVEQGRGAVALFERIGAQMIGKGVYTAFGRALAKTGDPEGIEVGRRVLMLAEHGADTLSAVWAQIALGESLLYFGQFDEAIERLERGLAIRDRDGFDVYVVAGGAALLVRAYAAKIRATRVSFAGRLRRTFGFRVRQAVHAGRRFRPMRSPAYLARGLAYHFAGRPQQAIHCFEESARLAAGLGARLWEADARLETAIAVSGHEGATSHARHASSNAHARYMPHAVTHSANSARNTCSRNWIRGEE